MLRALNVPLSWHALAKRTRPVALVLVDPTLAEDQESIKVQL